MNIEILGCSGGIGKDLKTTTYLVNDHTLIDAGTGVELLTLEQMLQIRTIFITHAHVDHIASLPLMLTTIFSKKPEPINVYALPEVIAALKEHVFNWIVWPDFAELPPDKPIVRLNELVNDESQYVDGLKVTSLYANHPTPTCGYHIVENERSFIFSGDTGINPELWPYMNRVKTDLLFIDVTYPNDQDELARLSGHLTPRQLADQIDELTYRPIIKLTHQKPGYEEAVISECQSLMPQWQLTPLKQGEIITL